MSKRPLPVHDESPEEASPELDSKMLRSLADTYHFKVHTERTENRLRLNALQARIPEFCKQFSNVKYIRDVIGLRMKMDASVGKYSSIVLTGSGTQSYKDNVFIATHVWTYDIEDFVDDDYIKPPGGVSAVLAEALRAEYTFDSFMFYLCLAMNQHFPGVDFNYTSSYTEAIYSPDDSEKNTEGSHECELVASWTSE